MKKTPGSKTVDEYLALVESEIARNSLGQIRSIIFDQLPDVEECISYGIPMYKLNGMVIGFGAFKNHCSIFPGHTVAHFATELKEYKTSKGTVQFDPLCPIPDSLI